MSKPVCCVAPGLHAEDAWQQMRANHVRHLLVVDHGKLCGVLSERDLAGRHGLSVRWGMRVRDLMSADVTVAHPQTTLRSAAAQLRRSRIGCLPVVDRAAPPRGGAARQAQVLTRDGKRLVGIVTRSDLLGALAGGGKRSAR